MSLRVVSYGGGVQSTALLVLTALVKRADEGDATALRRLRDYAARGTVDILETCYFTDFLFANVGDDSEHPKSLAYVHDIAMPFAAEHDIPIHELHRIRRDGSVETLRGRLDRSKRTVDIPVRMANGAPGNRNCTKDFKIKVVGKWLRQHGATAAMPAVVALGISMDEFQRAKTPIDARIPEQYRVDPLLDLRLTRQDCINIITDAGLPIAPKSACYFCPFNRTTRWQELKREEPGLFQQTVELEAMINRRMVDLGHTPVWMTRHNKPLDQTIGNQNEFDFEDTCESGYCMT